MCIRDRYVSVGLGLVLIAAGGLMEPGRQVAPTVGTAGLIAAALVSSYVYSRARA